MAAAAEPVKSEPVKLDETPETGTELGRWDVFRDVLAFQVKLLCDWFRDLLLAPISIGAALMGLMTEPDNPGKYFYKLMHLGRRSDHWINLFGAGSGGNPHRPPGDEGPAGDASVDDLVGRLETLVKAQYDRGGMTANAKNAIDRLIDRLNGAATARPGSPGDDGRH